MERETTQAARDAMRNATEGTGRLGSTVAGATTEAARAGADLLQRNLETAQRAWEASSQMTSQLLERSVGQFAGTAGISGAEGKTAAWNASHGLQGMANSVTALANGMQNVSREWLDLSQKTLQKTAHDFERLSKCRNGPEMLTIQTDIFRDRLDDFVQTTQRIAEIFVQTAEQATRKTTETASSS